VENPLQDVVKYADLHYMEEVGIGEVAHDTGNMLNHLESSVNIVRQVFGNCCHGVAIAKRFI
jgi:hypothetical protein